MVRTALAILPEVRDLLKEDPAELAGVLAEVHDEDLADLLELLDDGEAAQLLQLLPTEDAAGVLERVHTDTQETLVATLGPTTIAPIVSAMASDERTDLVDALPAQVSQDVLQSLAEVDPQAAAEVSALAKWPADTAGGLMTTEYVSVGRQLAVSQVIERVRQTGRAAETIYYVYLLDAGGALAGVVSLRDLLLAAPEARVEDVASRNVVQVAPETEQREVALLMAKYDFSALPVVGADGVLLGVITVDDVMDVLTRQGTEDLQRLGAVEPTDTPYLRTRFWEFTRKRAPWLLALFVSEFFTGTALRHYDRVIQAVTRLSSYVPLLISTGGNSGSQSASLIIRGLAVGDVRVNDWRRVLLRELGQGFVLGLCLAAIGVVRVWMWGDGTAFMWAVGASLVVIPVLGCTVGSMLPLVLRRLGFDPATGSAPFIATLVDVLGIVVFFNVAQIALADILSAVPMH